MPRISVYRLRHLAEVYTQEPTEHEPFSEILVRSGLEPDRIADPDARIDLLHEAGVIETACRSLDDKTFAARAALASRGPGTLLSYMVKTSGTVADALELAKRFYAVQDPDLRLEISETDVAVRVTIESGVIPSRQYPRHREFLLCGLYTRTRQIVGPGLWPLSLELETDDLSHCEAIAELAECGVTGNRMGYALNMPAGALSTEIPTADRTLLGHLLSQGETQLRKRPEAVEGLSDKVASMIRGRLPGQLPNGDEVASELGMTRRTMTRRLSAEGTNFKTLVDTARCDVSKALMIQNVSIAQIAFLLDFADQAAFSVAFKRWTGATPARYRKAH